jgi:chromate transporter
VMTFNFFFTSSLDAGVWQTIFLIVASYLLLEKWKVHPAYVITASLAYGGLFL